MTALRDYGTMQFRIADELAGRTDLLANSSGLSNSPIQLAILDAIASMDDQRFFFNEIRSAAAFSTVLNQEFYTVADWAEIPNIQHIDKLSILVSSNRYYMEPRTMQYMEDISVNPNNNGVPIDYAYYNQQIRLYPIPNGAYPVNFLGTRTFTELDLTTDSNAWTTEGERLIRLTAEYFLYRDTLKDEKGALMAKAGADEAFDDLKGMTFKRSATFTIRPSYF